MFFRVLARRDAYETNGDGSYKKYATYREAIAEDCQYRCGYCDCHQDSVGGFESMEMDHFRPWNKHFNLHGKAFEHLRDDPNNLVHACGTCNGFKWAHWPTEDPNMEFDDEKGWINPFLNDRREFLQVLDDGTLESLKAPASYQIKKLRLNRPLLRKQRELRKLILGWETTEVPKWQEIVANQAGSEHARTAMVAMQLLGLVKATLCPP